MSRRKKNKKRGPHVPSITPEIAHSLLHHTHATDTAAFRAAVQLKVQLALIPSPYRGEGDPPPNWNEPGKTICALSYELRLHPENKIARLQHDELMEKLIEDKTEEVRHNVEEGLPLWT